jgi:hypothetical protein
MIRILRAILRFQCGICLILKYEICNDEKVEMISYEDEQLR